jgi:hypothetical protein
VLFFGLRLSRRGLIGGLLLSLGIEPVLGSLRSRAQDFIGTFGVRAEVSPSPTRLSAAELDDLVAFAELLVEGRPLSAVERETLIGEIEARTTREPDLALYRTTVRLLERLAERRFSSLDLSARLDVMTRHRLASSIVRPDEQLGPYAEDVREVRTRTARNLIADYYVSSAGWAVVGYEKPPGTCGDLTRYTRAES